MLSWNLGSVYFHSDCIDLVLLHAKDANDSEVKLLAQIHMQIHTRMAKEIHYSLVRRHFCSTDGNSGIQ